MGLKFHETMSGSMTLNGQTLAFSFTVDALFKRWFLGGQKGQLQGVLSLEGVAQNAPLKMGILDIGWPYSRLLRYDLSWAGDDGEDYQFMGQKVFRFLRPVYSMTTLDGQVLKQGQDLGPAQLKFRLLDLPRFLFSFRPMRLS